MDIVDCSTGKITDKRLKGILKEYRYICWRIEVLEALLTEGADDIGIGRQNLDFLAKVFYQDAEINGLVNNSEDLHCLRIIKDVVDFSANMLKKHPNNGAVLHNVIDIMYIREGNGFKVKFDKAVKEHSKWAEENDNSACEATFKNRCKAAVDILLPIMEKKLNIEIEKLRAKAVENRPQRTIKPYNEREQFNGYYESTSEFAANS